MSAIKTIGRGHIAQKEKRKKKPAGLLHQSTDEQVLLCGSTKTELHVFFFYLIGLLVPNCALLKWMVSFNGHPIWWRLIIKKNCVASLRKMIAFRCSPQSHQIKADAFSLF